MADAHDQLPLLAHTVDKFHRNHSSIVCLTELFSSCIQCTTKSVSLHMNSATSAKHEIIRIHQVLIYEILAKNAVEMHLAYNCK